MAVLAVLALVVSACGSDDADDAAPATAAPATTAAPAATAAPAEALSELNVAYFLEWPTANQVAQIEQTYDDALGMTVNWLPFGSGGDMALAMESGDIDIAYSQGLTPFANFVTSGSELEIVGVAVSYADADNCVAHPDYGVTAANAAETLAGQKVYAPVGNVTHYKLLKMLEHLGVDLGSFEHVPSDGGAAAVAAFQSGDVAMACAFGGGVLRMLGDGGNLVMTGSEQEAIGIRVFDIISIPTQFGIDHPDVVETFLQVTEEANAAYAGNRRAQEAMIAEAAGMTVEGSNALLDMFSFPDRATQLSDAWLGGTVQDVMKAQMDFFVEQGEIPEALDSYDAFVNTTFLSNISDVEVVMASSGAGEGGTVTILYWQAASTLNPYLSGGWKDRDAGSVILEPLAEFDDQGVLVAALAADIPTVANGGVSADLKQITWSLQEGVLFSDGTPLTSDDVVFSWEYCSNPDTGCSGAGGFDGVTSVVAVDDLTVTITFEEATPFPYVPFVSNSYPIIQRAQFGDCVGAASAECTDENFAPIGTGPFKIESFTTNDTAVYVINEHYRGVADGKPYFGRVVIKGGGDAPATARSVLELGEADYAWNLQVEPEILAAMLAGGKGKVISAYSTMVERIMVNQTNPDPSLGDDRSEYMDGTNPHPFLTDPVVGRALSIAIDRQTLVDVGYGEAGRPTCNVWPAPPAQTSTAQDECLTQDIDLANQLLDDAGYADTDGDGVRETPDGVPMKILYQTSTNTVRQATQELIKQDWAKIGVETELRNIDASVFFGGDPGSPDTYGKFYADVEMYTNGAAGVDSQAYMGSWTTSNISGRDTTWQGSNVQRFQSDEYDTLHAELTQTADTARRNEITIALNDLVVGNYSIIPLIHRGSVSAVTNSLTGYKLNPWDAELWNIGDWGRN
jgi:peptide/nickel transport system substrate-binding protein